MKRENNTAMRSLNPVDDESMEVSECNQQANGFGSWIFTNELIN